MIGATLLSIMHDLAIKSVDQAEKLALWDEVFLVLFPN